MRENLFQRVWHNRLFDHENLITTCGKSVQVLNGGSLNVTDGPDFPGAKIRLDHIVHFGSVELHTHCSDWYLHGHHLDPKYNAVVLHVVLYPDNAGPVQLEDGTQAPTLILQSGLKTQWQTSLFLAQHKEGIPCSAFLERVSQNAIETQLHTAALEYFEEKRAELLSLFEPNLPPSVAFLKMLFLGWCEGLGIPHNRGAMRDLAMKAWDFAPAGSGDWPALQSVLAYPFETNYLRKEHTDELHILFLHIAGLNPHQKDDTFPFLDPWKKTGANENPGATPHEPMHRSQWNYKGGRGYNQPSRRVIQAANTLHFLTKQGMRYFLNTSADEAASHLSSSIYSGGERGAVLCRTVLLPSLDILADLFHKPRLHDQILKIWLNMPVTVPKAVSSAFSVNEKYRKAAENHAGSLRQYRHYCSKQRCEECNVFKNIIGG
jgi:hypothetical protein